MAVNFVTQAQRDKLVELYVGYFNRAPEAAGLNFWSAKLLDGINSGKTEAATLTGIANQFYDAGVQYNIFGAAQPVTDFIKVAYANALGRTSVDDPGMAYWTAKLVSGAVSRGEFVQQLIKEANAFKGDATWGWVATYMENRVAVANKFADNSDNITGQAAITAGTSALSVVTPATAQAGQTVAQALAAAEAAGVVGGGSIFTLTTGVDSIVGTAGNDTINATHSAATGSTTNVLGGLDKVDGGAGVDTLNIADTGTIAADAFALPAGFSMTNVEKLNVTTNGNIGAAATAFDVSTIAGLTDFAGVAAGTVGSNVKAADTTNVSLTVAGNAAATVAGGKAVAVVSGAAGTGATGVTGKGLTSVSVKGGGVVTIDNLGGAAGTTTSVGTTLTAVTLDGVAGATAAVMGAAVDTVTVKNQKTALATTVTNGTSTALTVNVDAAGYDALGVAVAGVTVAAGATATTINLNAVSKSNVAVSGAAATTLNITGAGALTLALPITTATKIDGSAATGALTLGVLDAATVNAKTGSGNDSLTLSATAKATVDTGAGNDSVTLASAVAAGSTINLGAGNDKLLVAGGSVAASTATAVTVIDGGDGIDTIAASLINAANAAQFKNFENIDVSSATLNALDVELMTGSAITGLTLTGGAGNATVNNVAAGVGLTVSGVNTGVTGNTTVGVKGALANTADTFAITFAGTAAAAATALAPTAVSAAKVVVANVETLNVSSAGTGFVANTLGLTADKLQTLTITGDKALTLTFDATTGTNAVVVPTTGGAVKLIDGSAATGVLNINTTNVVADDKAGVGLTVKTGSAKDVITLAQKATVDAGAGDDTITSASTGGTFTGGAGNDKFDVALATATGITEATAILTVITDLAAGDSIKLLADNVGTTLGAKTALDVTVTNLDQALAIAALTDVVNEVSWFQYGANTYLVANNGTAGFAASDMVVKITGLVDLSNSTLNTTTDYLTIV